MRLIRHINQINSTRQNAVTIGNFDGVHIGHEQIILKTQEIASKNNLDTTILTFQPHPIALFKPQNFQNYLISSLAQKLRIFKKYQIDNVVIIPFSRDFADLSAIDFIEKILVEKLKVKYLIIGYDFIFGKNREGNFELLQEKSKQHKFNIINIEALRKDNEIHSSSLVRKLIKEAKIKQANEVLGKNFAIEGVVISGKRLANKIGFPTANLMPKPHIIQPKFGVYKSEIFIPSLNKNFKAITNFGIKPTVAQTMQPLYETHIFDFNGALYGKKIEVKLLDFIREEKKFESLEALKHQIEIDIFECLS